MTNPTSLDTAALAILNLAIVGIGVLCILTLLGAVAYELGWRWWTRRSLPDAWPPAPPRGGGPRRVALKPAWPPLPDAWPPVEEESKR